MPLKTNDTNNTNCWSPPDLTNVNPDERITETLQLLSEATERLHQASSNNGDPDALVVQLPGPRQPFMGEYVSPLHLPPTGLSHPTAAAEDTQHFPEQNQWEPALPRSTQFESMENPEGLNGMLAGSGVEEHNWDGVPPGNQPQAAPPSESSIDFRKVPIPRPLPTTLAPSYVVPNRQPVDNFPLEGSAYEGNQPPYEVPGEDQWSPKQPDTRNPLGRDSIEGTDPYKPPTPIVEPSGQGSTASTSSMSVTQTTYPDTTTQEPTTTSEPITFASTTTLSTTTVITTARTTTPVVIPHTRNWRFQESSKEASTTQLPTTTEPTTISTTSSSAQQHKWSFKPITHYGGLPDDEDSLISPENTQPPSTSAPASFKEPSWSGSSKPGQQEASWWESSYAEGSGLPVESQSPNTQVNVPAYSENNYHLGPDKPTISTPQGAPGSGQLPFQGEPDQGSREAQPAYNVPPVGAQDPPRSMPFDNQPPNWVNPSQNPSQSYSTSQGSGMVDGVWLGGRSEESRGDDMWQENSLGSGASKPVEYQPTHVERPPSPPISVVPQPPAAAPPIVHPPPAMPYQPMPPPEIWVPAQLGPGQPAAPVLFVREYQVQGPFYSPEAMQTKPNQAAVHTPFWSLTAIVMLHARFAYM